MTGLITKAALLSACGMLVAAAAFAGVPSASTSTSPSFIKLVGSLASVPDSAAGKFTITVRDLALNPVNGSNVVVDFSGCTSDIRIASNQLNANYTVNCTSKRVGGFTNAAGQVAFTLLGNSIGVTPLHTGLSCARIYADGVLLSSPTVATFDLDGFSGVGGGDNSNFNADILAAYRGRSDFDGNGSITGGDKSVFLGVVVAGKSFNSNTACL